ncbi:C40 family peptidase [Paenibacillus sp. CECT 9249]|uniref:C40 family peptidase n=1 Tax=unclassified Paenibacillus TaxID=185978 RepID=UPI001E2D2ED1|nr:C40 family peptidase [Paenibacillus sp. CECT 9249]CAH0118222.1 hypothetical protein PAE9249_00689 [Paenibacillus sp. CECT 9249]
MRKSVILATSIACIVSAALMIESTGKASAPSYAPAEAQTASAAAQTVAAAMPVPAVASVQTAQAQWEKTADRIIDMGKTYYGTPYVFGAERFQDSTFDCSSFVQFLYDKEGISLGWNSREQAVQGETIPFDQMRKGDLMYFSDEDYPNEQGINKVRHVGIYMGDGKILHTYEEGIGVIVSDIHGDKLEGEYWYEHFLWAKRVIPE